MLARMVITTMPITRAAVERSTDPMVSARWTRRAITSGSESPPATPVRTSSPRALRRTVDPPATTDRTVRVTSHRAMLSATTATAIVIRVCRGAPTIQSNHRTALSVTSAGTVGTGIGVTPAGYWPPGGGVVGRRRRRRCSPDLALHPSAARAGPSGSGRIGSVAEPDAPMPLLALAERYGVVPDYRDFRGGHRHVTAATLVAVLGALGGDAAGRERGDGAREDVENEGWRRRPPPVMVLRAGEEASSPSAPS